MRLILVVIVLNLLRTGGLSERQVIWQGKPVYLYQNTSYCIHKIGQWLMKVDGKCSYYDEGKYRITGSLHLSLIDRLMGWIWVDVGREDVVLIKPEMMKKGTFTSLIEVSATKLWSGADSGLVLAMALGQKDALRTDFAKALKKAGVSHIAVASGFNVMLVASPILSLLLWFFKRRLATVVALVGVWGYILLIGAGYSVVRAGLMISLYLTLLAVGRSVVSWYLLSLVVLGVWAVDPGSWWSISWQLSVAATLGLIWLGPKISKAMEGSWQLWRKLAINETLAATALTLPLVYWHFAQMNYFFVLSNSLIVPIVPILTILGVLSILVEILLGWGILLAIPTSWLLTYLKLVLGWYN